MLPVEKNVLRKDRGLIFPTALVLLNDPVFVKQPCCRKILKSSQPSDEDKISFLSNVPRKPSKEETKVIRELLENQRERYKKDEKAAMNLLKTGMKAYDTSIETSELAAWTSVSRTLLNMYETTARL